MVTKVKKRLPRNHLVSMGINVEFIPGKVGILNPAPPDDNGLSMIGCMREDGVPVMGTSIEMLPKRGDGSLGPFITLRYENDN